MNNDEKIKDFKESDIRKKILSKIKPKRKNKRSPHQKRYIMIDNKIITKVKLPNNHDRIMHHNKSQYIARDLKLSNEDFNRLIDCPLKGSEYFQIIKKFI